MDTLRGGMGLVLQSSVMGVWVVTPENFSENTDGCMSNLVQFDDTRSSKVDGELMLFYPTIKTGTEFTVSGTLLRYISELPQLIAMKLSDMIGSV